MKQLFITAFFQVGWAFIIRIVPSAERTKIFLTLLECRVMPPTFRIRYPRSSSTQRYDIKAEDVPAAVRRIHREATMRFVSSALFLALVIALVMSLPMNTQAQPNKGAAAVYALEPVAANLDNVGASWNGHDFASLARHGAKPQQGEFETAAQLEARYRAQLERPAYGRVRLADRIALTGTLSRQEQYSQEPYYQYDVERERFQVCLASRDYLHGRDEKILGIYTASNAYGATVKVQRRFIRVLWVSFTIPTESEQCAQWIAMPRAAAQVNTKNASWALIGTLREPYAVVAEFAERPTFNDPYDDDFYETKMAFVVDEVIAYDRRTGRVFYRSRWDGR